MEIERRPNCEKERKKEREGSEEGCERERRL